MSIKPDETMDTTLDRYLGCFGSYRSIDPVCKQGCALNMRCAIEREQSERYEILEELVSANDLVVKVN